MLYSVVHFPPPDIQEAVRRCQAPYAASFEVKIAPHFTLHPPFESHRPPDGFCAVLRRVCSRTKPFPVRICSVDSFAGQKLVLFMKLDDESGMSGLQRDIDLAITESDWSDVLAPGVKPRPHLTIGFFKQKEDLEKARAGLAATPIHLAWTVDCVDLLAEVEPDRPESVRRFRLGE